MQFTIELTVAEYSHLCIQLILCYRLGVGKIDVVISSDIGTILAHTPQVFYGGENCLNVRTQHFIDVVICLNAHAFLAQRTYKLYAGEKCRSVGTEHTTQCSGLKCADAHAISPPQKAYGIQARIARASVLAISLTTIGCRDQSYLQFSIVFTVAQ